MGDNLAAWQKIAKKELHLESNVCQTHATAIAANNCSHKKHFNDPNKNYNGFYEFVCPIMCCSFAEVGEHLQTLLVNWLRSVREGRAAEWFETWWCGFHRYQQLPSSTGTCCKTWTIALIHTMF
jgi:hypothetical protein